MKEFRNPSFWWDTLPEELSGGHRASLTNDISVDVAIIGAGYTGLWTAYYLQRANPELSIAILEAQIAGFGASGRNGGWCSSYFPTEIDKLAKMTSRAQAKNMQDAMHATVGEVHDVIRAEKIDCDWQQSGSVSFARTPLQWQRAQEYIHHWESWGYGSEHYSLLNRDEANAVGRVTNAMGATRSAHVAAMNPAKLVRSLAQVVESRGTTIYEHSPVTSIAPHVVVTDQAKVTARYIVRATEGYTPTLDGMKRAIAPIYSLMVATEPLSQDIWDQIGFDSRATFTDWRNLIIYGQRTADGRFAFGGRGAPYHFGSSIKSEYDQHASVHAGIVEVLKELFPVLGDVAITHTWGGPLGIARDWMASAGLDAQTGIAWAGGYVGDGVGTTNLSGRTLADLITGTQSALTKLPWVNHKSPSWEPEPLRWLGANAGLQVMTWADNAEDRSGKPSKIGNFVSRFLGQ